MDALLDFGALDDCQNMEESYGEICVGCGRCGRQPERQELSPQALADVERLFGKENVQ